MKYIAGGVLALLIIVAYMSVTTEAAYAFGFTQPFGGLVTMTTNPIASCASGIGPVTIKIAGRAATGPYLFSFSKTPPPAASRYVLGLYSPILSPEGCTYNTPYKPPYSTYHVTLYGTSQ